MTAKVSEESVWQYLQENPDFLEKFVITKVSADCLKKWCILKKQWLTRAKIPDKEDTTSDCPTMLFSFSREVASAMKADNSTLYLQDPTQENNLLQFASLAPCELPESILVTEGLTVQGHVAATKDPILYNSTMKDESFPAGMGEPTTVAQSVLCLPLVMKGDNLVGVVVLTRTPFSAPFSKEDRQACENLYDNFLSDLKTMDLIKRQSKHDLLLLALRSCFNQLTPDSDPHVVLESIIVTLYQQTGARGGSLFLVDLAKQEFYAKVFMPSFDHQIRTAPNKLAVIADQKNKGEPLKEIRIPLEAGIAGLCYKINKIINVSDCENDERVYKMIDNMLGITSHNLLAIPIAFEGKVIGVIEIVNKVNDSFNEKDEKIGGFVAVVCAIVVTYLQTTEHNKVLNKLLSHHRQCTDREVQILRGIDSHKISEYPLGEFGFDCSSIPEDLKPVAFITMLQNLSKSFRFSKDQLMNFILSVRRSYHDIPYHNWDHGICVAHTIYTILKHSQGIFTELESVALLVAGICHDLEHPGQTNAFMVQSGDPLAVLYSSSPLEYHHFNQACLILSQKQNDIFCYIESEKPKIYEVMEGAILATDLAVYSKNNEQLKGLLTNGGYDIKKSNHRSLVRAVLMSTSDLSAGSLPWDQHYKKVQCLFEEFYIQGDREKEEGRTPLPLMDRSKSKAVPKMEVFFLSNIYMPCCDAITKVMPAALPLLRGAQKNLAQWKSLSSK
ncbi:cAMP and cAMP-inhibited cGMP 3',5'-cyclic phosphodiesterase 10A-like [Dysidea avara]|uniref:cAMP and cAMP-inhibited cGMP 3',5'-cyclic phosphodiesterase 10A-like n=1 Tax=Dysidea avara TaxID=196820 RepID=UPI00332FCF0D